MQRIIFVTILLLPIFLMSLTLDEAIDYALKNNKELQMAKEDVEVANKEYKNIKGSLLPQVTGQVGIFNSHTNLPDKYDVTLPSISGSLDSTASDNDQTIAGITDGLFEGQLPDMKQDATQYGAKVKLDQVVYLGGKLLAGIKAAKKYEHLTENQFKVKEIDVVYDTKKAYYSVLMAQEALAINKEALSTAEKHLTQVENMNENGVVSEYDFLRAKLEVKKLQPEVISAENNLILAKKENLAKKIGLPVNQISLTDEIEFEFQNIPDMDQSIATGLENRKELKLTGIARDMYELQYKAEKGNYLPNIVFQAEVNHFAEGDDQFSIESDDFGTSYQYGLALEIPIFTGFSNKAKDKAKAQLRKSKLDDLNLRDLITLDIKNSYLNYQKAIENLDVQTENTLLAAKGLEIANVRFENNIGIQLEVFDAQLQVNIAKLSLLSAKYEAIISYETYKKAIGSY